MIAWLNATAPSVAQSATFPRVTCNSTRGMMQTSDATPERRLIEARYAPIEMPGTRIETPNLSMSANWRIGDMLGYLRTWSACNRYRKERGTDPVSLIGTALGDAWGDDIRKVTWPVTLLARRLG